MKVEVRPLNDKGRPLSKAARQAAAASRGMLKVADDRMHAFGRVVRCARVVSDRDGTEMDLLPPLLDMELLWADGELMRLRGNEQVGDVLFGQTWEVRVL
jgi:hypothetical protein